MTTTINDGGGMDREAKQVDSDLRVTLLALVLAKRRAAEAGYGGEFLGELDNATRQVEYVRSMLR